MTTALESALSQNAAMYDLLREVRDCFETDTRGEMRYAFLRGVSIHLDGRVHEALSREISGTGIGLLHQVELQPGKVEVAISTDDGTEVRIHVLIRWCKSVAYGWHVSGGDFVENPDLID